MSEKLITEVPLEYKASAPVVIEVNHVPEITEVPFQREVLPQESDDLTSHEAIDDIGVFRLPKLGGAVLEAASNSIAIDSVPGVSNRSAVEPGAPVNGPRESIVIGGIDDFKGGDPSRVIGYDQITKK